MSRKCLASGLTIVIATVTFCSSTALAYILPADAILSSVAKRRATIELDSLVLEGTVDVGDKAPHPVWEALVPGKAHRVEHKIDGSTQVVTTIGGRRWQHALDEKPSGAEIVKDDLVLTFLGAGDTDPGGKRGIRFAERLGIDTNVVSLARLDHRIAFVIGAKPWEPTKPQIWVDKRFRVPVRLIEVDGDGNVKDTRLLGFGSPVTGEWYPRRIEVYENGTLVHRTTYERLKINEPIEPKLIEPPTS